MKNISKLFCLLLSSFLITGCVAVNPYLSQNSSSGSSSTSASSTSSPTSSSSSSSSTSEPSTDEEIAFRDYLESIPEEYGVQFQYLDNNFGMVDLYGQKTIHKNKYFACTNFTFEDGERPGGFLLAGNGYMYEWEADDVMEGNNFHVLAENHNTGDMWSNYFVNMPFMLEYSHFTPVYDNTNTLQYFEMINVASEYDYIFNNIIEQFVYSSTALFFERQYELSLFVISEENGNSYDYTFLLESYPLNNQFDICYTYFRLITNPYDLIIPTVDEYVESGSFPQEYDYSEYTDRITSMAEAKNYQIHVQSGWINTSTLEFADYSSSLSLIVGNGYESVYEDYFPDGVEDVIVTYEGIYSNYLVTQHFDKENGSGLLSDPIVSDPHQTGLYTYDGSVYEYSYDTSSSTWITSDTGVSGLWGGYFNYLLVRALIPNNYFTVSYREEISPGTFRFTLPQQTATEYSLYLLRQSASGRFINYAFNSIFGTGYADYISMIITVSEESLSFVWVIRLGAQACYGQKVTFSNVGGNTLPISESDLFPSA